MMTATLTYTGNLECKIVHTKSNTAITTDAPTDNNGRGSSFSPTDLTCVSLATCMITTIGIEARKRNWNIDGSRMSIKKVMTNDPRRIDSIIIEAEIEGGPYSNEDKRLIEYLAMNCPVILSLHPDVKKTLTLKWPNN